MPIEDDESVVPPDGGVAAAFAAPLDNQADHAREFAPRYLIDIQQPVSGSQGVPTMVVTAVTILLQVNEGEKHCELPTSIRLSINLRADTNVQLHKAEKAWKAEKVTETDLESEEVKKKRLLKKVRAIFNKITPTTMDTLLNEFLDYKVYQSPFLSDVISIIHDKAVDEPMYCPLYVSMCTTQVGEELKENNNVSKFRLAILASAQDTFTTKTLDDFIKEKEAEIDAETDDKKKKEKQIELLEAKSKFRRRKFGNIIFIGQLYLHGLISVRIIIFCVVHLLKSVTEKPADLSGYEADEESVECAVRLLETIGKRLHENNVTEQRNAAAAAAVKAKTIQRHAPPPKQQPPSQQFPLDLAFQTLDTATSIVSSRIKFMIMNLVELRKNGWVPRKTADAGPKKLDEIKNDIEREQLENAQKQQRVRAEKEIGGCGVDGSIDKLLPSGMAELDFASFESELRESMALPELLPDTPIDECCLCQHAFSLEGDEQRMPRYTTCCADVKICSDCVSKWSENQRQLFKQEYPSRPVQPTSCPWCNRALETAEDEKLLAVLKLRAQHAELEQIVEPEGIECISCNEPTHKPHDRFVCLTCRHRTSEWLLSGKKEDREAIKKGAYCIHDAHKHSLHHWSIRNEKSELRPLSLLFGYTRLQVDTATDALQKRIKKEGYIPRSYAILYSLWKDAMKLREEGRMDIMALNAMIEVVCETKENLAAREENCELRQMAIEDFRVFIARLAEDLKKWGVMALSTEGNTVKDAEWAHTSAKLLHTSTEWLGVMKPSVMDDCWHRLREAILHCLPKIVIRLPEDDDCRTRTMELVYNTCQLFDQWCEEDDED